MSNFEQLRNIRKYKKRRRIVSRIGGFLAVIGFALAIIASGEQDISFLITILLGVIGCGLFGLGVYSINFIEYINKERPLVYKPVDKGDDLWYNIYINLKKRSENYND